MSKRYSLWGAALTLSIAILSTEGWAKENVPEAKARLAFENHLRMQLQGAPFKIISFHKTNGQELNFLGIPSYAVMYEATVQYPQGFHPECMTAGMGSDCVQYHLSDSGQHSVEAVGAIAREKGELDFQKTDKGWQGKDGRIY